MEKPSVSFALLFFRSAWLDLVKTGSPEEGIHTMPAECLANGKALISASHHVVARCTATLKLRRVLV
jgi:hypothetical protein